MIRYPYEGWPDWDHTVIGAHLHPYSYHSWTLREPQRSAHLPVLREIRANWVVMLTSGDSCLEVVDGKPAVCWYLDEGIVPIIRDQATLPRRFQNYETVKRLVAEYKPYGLRPTIQLWNEWGDNREWVGGDVPNDWRDIALDCFKDAAPKIIALGANVGFADPLSDWHYFFEGMREFADYWQDGLIVMLAHLYHKARPINYPEDAVSRYGEQLTEMEWRKLLDDFWDVPGWREQTLEQINRARLEQASPSITWRDDHTCFGAWRNIRQSARDVFGCEIAMALTEGGPCPNDRAGSGPNADIRYIPTTPKQVAVKTVEMMQSTNHGMYAVCPWLLWGGESSQFQSDHWLGSLHGGIVNQDTGKPYGWRMPVIDALAEMEHPPPEYNLWGEVVRHVEAIREMLE